MRPRCLIDRLGKGRTLPFLRRGNKDAANKPAKERTLPAACLRRKGALRQSNPRTASNEKSRGRLAKRRSQACGMQGRAVGPSFLIDIVRLCRVGRLCGAFARQKRFRSLAMPMKLFLPHEARPSAVWGRAAAGAFKRRSPRLQSMLLYRFRPRRKAMAASSAGRFSSIPSNS